MDDLEKGLRQALGNPSRWSTAKTRGTLKCITGRVPGASSDWDEGNENWATVSHGSRGIAYVCARVPFIVALQPFADEVKACADDAVILGVDDLDQHRYRVPRVLLEEIFAKPVTSIVSYDALSIRDLWYATVS